MSSSVAGTKNDASQQSTPQLSQLTALGFVGSPAWGWVVAGCVVARARQPEESFFLRWLVEAKGVIFVRINKCGSGSNMLIAMCARQTRLVVVAEPLAHRHRHVPRALEALVEDDEIAGADRERGRAVGRRERRAPLATVACKSRRRWRMEAAEVRN